ncbi:MAG: hypothetical protein V3U16_05195, partial [Candidatus Neomarinimicrobiota bacterium]
IIINQTLFLDSAIIKNQLTAHLSQFNFVQNSRDIIVPREFTTSFFYYLINESPKFFNRITSLINVIHIVIPLCILLSYSWYSLRMIVLKRQIFLILIAITLLPLSLHLIAWDTSRIWTYPLVVAILAVWEINEIFPTVGAKERNPLLFCISAIMVVVVQLFISTPLMDSMRDRFTIELRILLYTPSLILITMLVSKNFVLTKELVKYDK